MHSNTFMPMGKGFIFTPKATSACTKTDFGAMEMLIVAPMIPKCMHQSKMPIFGKARKSHELWFGVPGRCATFVFFFCAHRKKNFGQVKLTAAYKLQHVVEFLKSNICYPKW
jgi:hypothetical protein